MITVTLYGRAYGPAYVNVDGEYFTTIRGTNTTLKRDLVGSWLR